MAENRYNITNVYLVDVPFKNDYKHTVYFKDRASQYDYMYKRAWASSYTSNFTYVLQDSKLRVNLSLEETKLFNYVMYQNTFYGNKWFYAFITNYEWKNDDVTELTLETDVMQTYLYDSDYEIYPSFIEREHTDDDTIGANTIPENLEMGEYIVNKVNDLTAFTSMKVVVGVTQTKDKTIYPGRVYNGCWSGIHYKAFPFTTEGLSALRVFLQKYDLNGLSDSVVSMFLAPSELTETTTYSEYQETEVITVKASTSPYNKMFNFPKSSYLEFKDGYKPNNNKLYTYPYNYILVSNNNGSSAIYQFEQFGENISFTVYGVLTPGCSIRAIPMSYKGVLDNHEEGINFGKYPICNWVSNEYTNWMTQNSLNMGLNIASGLGQIVGGIGLTLASGGLGTAIGGSSIVSGISAITGQIAQTHQMSFTPPQSKGNTNSGDVITAINKNTLTIYQMCCKPEFMMAIDEFLSAYGYKCNRIKKPNMNHRKLFWYTKTVDVNIKGEAIPNNDLQKIKNCYNNGITFWNATSAVGNYDFDNNKIV